MTNKYQVQPVCPLDIDPIKGLLKSCGLPFEDITPEYLAHFFAIHQGGTLIGAIGIKILGVVHRPKDSRAFARQVLFA
jgi:hypothetical protein